MKAKRDIGKLGESTLRVWAAQVSATINSSDGNDKTGWDFLLEFPFAEGPSTSDELSGDLLPQEIACFVQVKATDFKNKTISISLAHWKRQIEKPNPTFFLVLEFDKKDAPQRAFLVEVDKDLAEKALKRLRKVPTGKLNRLHKMKMGFKYDKSHEIGELSGASLIGRIRQICGPDPKAYCSRKLEWQTVIGYKERPVEISVTFKEEDELERFRKLVAFSLGEIDSLAVSSLEIGHSRFGIVKKRASLSSDLSIQVPKLPSIPVRLSLENEFKSQRVSLDAEGLFPGALFPFIPQQYWRVKIKSKLIQVHWDVGNKKITFSFKSPAAKINLPLSEWLQVLSIVELFYESEKHGVYVEATTGKGQLLFKEQIKSSFHHTAELNGLRVGLVALKQVLHLAQMPQDFEVSLDEILDQANHFANIARVIKDRKAEASVTVTLLDDSVISGTTVGVFYFWQCRMGEKLVSLAVSAVGALKDSRLDEDGKRQITLEPIETEIHSVSSMSLVEAQKFDFRKVLEEVAAKFSDLESKIIIA